MKAFAALSFLATLAAQVAALTVNTPASIVQCEPVQFTWTNDGTSPYFLTLLPGGQVSASPLKDFGSQTGTSFTWTCDLASGTSVTVALRDSTGTQVFSDAVTIQSSSDSSCLNSAVDESGSATGSSGTTATGSTTAAGTTTAATTTGSVATTTATTSKAGTTTATTGTSSKASTTGMSSSSASSSTTSSNAAARGSTINSFGVAGLLGLVGAALL